MKKTATLLICLCFFFGSFSLLWAQDTIPPPQEEKVQQRARLRPHYVSQNRRDPFRNLLAGRDIKDTASTDGIPQILIEDILLVGIVELNGKFTAIINDKEGFPYSIHVGDKFADGYVRAIEERKVIFRKTHERGVPLRRVRDITKEIII
jgi:hypothetical protein